MPETALASTPESSVLRGAERCVACGLCLPACPTYRLTQDESESPRGRIALMRALVRGDIAPGNNLTAHLQHCLGCRACERICPSGVPYGQMFDTMQGLITKRNLRKKSSRRGIESWLVRLVTSPSVLRLVSLTLYGYQRSGLQAMLRASGIFRPLGLMHAEMLLPQLAPMSPLQEFYPAVGEHKGLVTLFTGCIANHIDVATRADTIRVLNALGYNVQVPPNQGCCGALSLSAGLTNQAKLAMQHNLAAFAPADTTIVSTASGCGALLEEYDRHLDGPDAAKFSSHVTDISTFLLQADWQKILLRALPRRVAVHDPCTLTNGLGQEQAPYELLQKIPRAEIVPLPENRFCCGGAGSYPLTQPDMALRLREEKVRHLRAVNPDFLVTSNIGCALQLGAGLRTAGLRAEVLHPVSLLARQLPDR